MSIILHQNILQRMETLGVVYTNKSEEGMFESLNRSKYKGAEDWIT